MCPTHRLSAGAGRHVLRVPLGHDWRDVVRGGDSREDEGAPHHLWRGHDGGVLPGPAA